MNGIEGVESGLQAGQLLSAISTRIVAIVRECYGRGPTKAKTFLNDDIVFVVRSGNGFTPLEKTIIDSGRPDRVLEMRRDFQEMMSKRFSDAIEELTGRKVVAFLSQANVQADLTVEIFFLDRSMDAGGRMGGLGPDASAHPKSIEPQPVASTLNGSIGVRGPHLDIQVEPDDGALRVVLAGELDVVSAPALEARLERLRAADAGLRLDLSKLAFMDSTGLGLVIRIVKAARADGSQLEIDPNVSSPVMGLFRLMELDRWLWGDGEHGR
jgi:anti-anti-sigma factor